MVQWINVHQNNSFLNLSWLPFVCQKTGDVALAQPGLIAGRLTDEMLLHLEFFKN